MKDKNNSWFTLVEIIVSTIILMIWVFSVYKLISSNFSTIESMWNNLTSTSLLLNSKECLKNIWYTNLESKANQFFLDFWINYNECNISVFDNTFSSSWMLIDNKEYYIVSTKTSWPWSNPITIDIKIISDTTDDVIWNLEIFK